MSFDTRKTHNRMMGVYLVLMVGVFIGIVIMLIHIQGGKEGEKWRSQSAKREISLRSDPAQRGSIYSTDGKILATTMPVCDFYIDLTRKKATDINGNVKTDANGNIIWQNTIADSVYLEGLDLVCRMLDSVNVGNMNKGYAYYWGRIDGERQKPAPKGCWLVQRGLPYSVWDSIRHIKGWNRAVVKTVDGESVVRDVRAHIYGNLAANTVGFYTRVSTSTGLEGYYDSILAGQDGQYWCRRLTRGVWIKEDVPGKVIEETDDEVVVGAAEEQERIDGSDIIATIDTRYQDIAHSALLNTLKQYNAESGCAVLMEMNTGYVLACSNISWDTSSKSYYEMVDKNIACSDMYEPGSTFKSVILTAMMNDTMVGLDTNERVRTGHKVFSARSGEITDGQHAERDTVNIATVLARSSNVGMCELGWKYYNNRRNDLKKEVEKIFPYSALHLDVKANESDGHINNLAQSDRDFLNFCYGYANSVSVMQMLTFYNALGAGGRMVKPLFCRGIIVNGQQRVIEPVVLKERICSPQTAKIMKDMLVGVVEHGTGNNIKNSVYGIAGKTGTAVYSYANKNLYTASFAGFFPAEHPKYSCIVVVKRVAAHGRQAAAPVFKKISDCVVAIDEDLGYVELRENESLKHETGFAKKMPLASKIRRAGLEEAYVKMGIDTTNLLPKSEWVVWNREEDSTGLHESYEEYELPEGVIPNCAGMSIREAIVMLRSLGLQVRFTGFGKVVSQSPKFKTPCQRGDIVYLQLK